MTRKNAFLSEYDFLSISHIKRRRNHIISKGVEGKVKKLPITYMCAHVYTDTQVLTSHVDKIAEL